MIGLLKFSPQDRLSPCFTDLDSSFVAISFALFWHPPIPQFLFFCWVFCTSTSSNNPPPPFPPRFAVRVFEARDPPPVFWMIDAWLIPSAVENMHLFPLVSPYNGLFFLGFLQLGSNSGSFFLASLYTKFFLWRSSTFFPFFLFSFVPRFPLQCSPSLSPSRRSRAFFQSRIFFLDSAPFPPF